MEQQTETLLEEVNGGLYYMDKAQITVGEIGGIVAKLEGPPTFTY